MKRSHYRATAIATLPLPLGAAYFIGQPVASWITTHVSGADGALLGVLAYALAALVCVLTWGALLVPLRARAGFTPIAQELKKLADLPQGGLAEEMKRQKARAASSDPAVRAAYHYTSAGVGALIAVGGILISLYLWGKGYYMAISLAAWAFGVPYSLYHLLRGLLASAAARKAPRDDGS